MPSQSQRFLPLPFFLALLGLLFSLWNILGDSSALCVTEGCSLFQDFTIAGISMWWGGVAGCSVLMLAAVPGFSGVGFVLAGTGLVLDCLLLVIMLFTAPCFNCMIIGLFLALIFMAFRRAVREGRRQRAPTSVSPLLALWTLLFVLNIGCLLHSMVSPWALREHGDTAVEPAHAAMQIYFSPSCEACRTLVKAAGLDAASIEAMGGAAWYPVAENQRDIWIIMDMKRRMDGGSGLALALDTSIAAAPERIAPQELLTPSMLLMQFRLWRNRAHVLNSGSARLPFVEFRGLPSMLDGGANAAAASAAGNSGTARSGTGSFTSRSPVPLSGAQSAPNASNLPFLGVTGFCEEGGAVPCETTPGSGESLSDVMAAPQP